MKHSTVTGAQAGVSSYRQILIALGAIVANGGSARMPTIYDAVEEQLADGELSAQGKASLRALVNRDAVRLGYIYPHDPKRPGWRITPKGRDFLSADRPEVQADCQ